MTHVGSFPTPLYWLLGIVAAVSIGFVFLKTRLKGCELPAAFLVYVFVMIAIAFVFKRGTFLQRLLIPSYPLVVMGGGELVNMLYSHIKSHVRISVRCERIANGVLLSLFLSAFLWHVDVLHTRDWYDDYRIRDQYMNGVERTDPNPCWDFYELQKQSRLSE